MTLPDRRTTLIDRAANISLSPAPEFGPILGVSWQFNGNCRNVELRVLPPMNELVSAD
jgi:hypothetical protein